MITDSKKKKYDLHTVYNPKPPDFIENVYIPRLEPREQRCFAFSINVPIEHTLNISPWFVPQLTNIQKIIPLPDSYKPDNIPSNYINIITDYHVNNANDIAYNINDSIIEPINNKDDKLVRTHTYKIYFNSQQKDTLNKWYLESKRLYDLCVDIWKNYKEIPSNKLFMASIIYKHFYRQNKDKSRSQIIENIIKELKLNREEYEIKKEQNKDLLNRLWDIAKEEHKKKVIDYTERKNNMKKLKVPFNEKKPRFVKPKLPKEERERAPRKKYDAKLPAPDEVLKGVIHKFCESLTECKERINSKTINNFDFKYKDFIDHRTIVLAKTAIKRNGIYPQLLKQTECKKYKKIYDKYTEEYREILSSELYHDVILNKYYFLVHYQAKYKTIEKREKIVAIDEGEKKFLAYYSQGKYGDIGDNMRIFILKIGKKIKKVQSKLSRVKSNKRKIQYNQKIKRLYKVIQGYVNEVHKKAAKYLCENYERIIIPKFETKPMISNKKKEVLYKKAQELKNQKEYKDETRKIKKQVRMSKEVKFVLERQSHYKFKEYLKAKATEYSVKLYDTGEDYTTQTCTKCGMLSKEYDYRTKKCPCCKYEIDRDRNGSRNTGMKGLLILLA